MRDFKGMKRQRGRNRGSGGPPGGGKPQQNANRSFDSSGPENAKVRGNAQTVYEKYQQLARDAFQSGDRVLAEGYLQHAEHYFRLLRLIQPNRPTAEIVARDVFHSGVDIDFEEEAAAIEAAAAAGTAYGEPAPSKWGGESGDGETREDGADRNADGSRPRYENRGDRDRFNDRDRNRGDRFDRDRNQNDRGDRFADRDRQQGERYDRDRPQGDRSQSDRTQAERGQGDRNQGERPDRFADRDRNQDRGQDRGQGDRFNNDRGDRNDRNERGDRFADRGDRGRRDNRRDERPRAEGEARSDRFERSDRPRGERDDADAGDRGRDRYEPVDRGDGAYGDAPAPTPAPEPAPLLSHDTPSSAAQLRSQDGGFSEAPAFLQASAAPTLSESPEGEEAPPRRTRRPRRRTAELVEGGGESFEPAPIVAAGDEQG